MKDKKVNIDKKDFGRSRILKLANYLERFEITDEEIASARLRSRKQVELKTLIRHIVNGWNDGQFIPLITDNLIESLINRLDIRGIINYENVTLDAPTQEDTSKVKVTAEFTGRPPKSWANIWDKLD